MASEPHEPAFASMLALTVENLEGPANSLNVDLLGWKSNGDQNPWPMSTESGNGQSGLGHRGENINKSTVSALGSHSFIHSQPLIRFDEWLCFLDHHAVTMRPATANLTVMVPAVFIVMIRPVRVCADHLSYPRFRKSRVVMKPISTKPKERKSCIFIFSKKRRLFSESRRASMDRWQWTKYLWWNLNLPQLKTGSRRCHKVIHNAGKPRGFHVQMPAYPMNLLLHRDEPGNYINKRTTVLTQFFQLIK